MRKGRATGIKALKQRVATLIAGGVLPDQEAAELHDALFGNASERATSP
jgi:hypothetical protein